MFLFAAKLNELGGTIDLALASDCTRLAAALRQSAERPAIAVGSGGSAITANFFATCRRSLGHATTRAKTPLEFVLSDDTCDSDVWLFSAGGSNPDILAACAAALARGCSTLNVVTREANSKLAALAQQSNATSVHVTPAADPRDGFLATHSLASAVTQLLLASNACLDRTSDSQIAAKWRTASLNILSSNARTALGATFQSVGRQDTLFVLLDPRLSPVATLVETSAWEAALCAVQRTDFRNFAHGRQTWLAKRPAGSFVLALTGELTREVWNDISTALPSNVRTHTSDFSDCGVLENARGLLIGLTIVEALGLAVGIDPARPGDTKFGGAIFKAPSLLKVPPQSRR